MTNKDTKILIVDDQPANLRLLAQTLESEGYKVLTAPNGEIALKVAPRAQPDLVLLDVVMPGIDGFAVCRQLKENAETQEIPVIFITARTEQEDIVQAFEMGGVDYIQKPFQEAEVRVRVQNHLKASRLTQQLIQKNRELERAIRRRETAEAALQKADAELSALSEQEAERWGIKGFVGKSRTITEILDKVRQLQAVGTTGVLIMGESGTGKELIARAIHFGGSRRSGRFVALNCSAIPQELVESTLFGHVRGAFTGASASRQGCFERADGGTLFLDEIGDMPVALQAKLLRVLEDGHFTPVGGSEEKRADVRILAATNANLQQKIALGAFRQDLYFRLSRFTVEVPPLRDRIEDIPLLASHFLSMFSSEMGKEGARFSPEALDALRTYHFPGNVRELKNIIEHALILSRTGVILPEHLHFIDMGPEKPILAPTQDVFEDVQQIVFDRAQSDDERKILAYLKQHGSITNRQCCMLLDVDKRRATYLLQKLLKYGLLVHEGKQRWSRYRLSTPMNAI